MFYKTPKGAEVGDVYMSLIHTCELNSVNPFAYLQALQVQAKEVMEHAALWLPWNYHDQLDKRGADMPGADLVLSKGLQSGAALVRVGSPPMSSTCNPQASSVRVGKAASGQKEKHPLDSRFWHNQNP